MRRATFGLLAGLMFLAACTVEPPAGTSPRRSAGPASRGEASPSGGETAPPSSAAPATAAPASDGPTGLLASTAPGAGQPLRLARPAVPVKVVVGKVMMDASYLVAAGSGNILSHNGGLIVAAGGGNVLSHNGSQVISHNGGQIIAAGAGNVIVNNSSNLVAAGAGNLVAAGGLNYVATAPGSYALAQATSTPGALEAPAPLAAGTQLPAAGMELRARSLRTGEALPLGVGPDGEPVFAVYTNAEGGYEVFLPDSEAGNVLLEARVPGAVAPAGGTPPAAPDPRLSLDVLSDTRQAAPAAAAAPGSADTFGSVMNEESAIATEYIRTCLLSRFVEVCQREDIAEIVRTWGASKAAVSVVSEFVNVYRGLSEETGLISAGPAEAEKVGRRVLDITLAHADLFSAEVPPDIVPDWTPPATPPAAIAEIMAVITHSRNQVAAKMQADPQFLSTWAFKAERTVGFKPVKASDPASFAVTEYLVSSDWTNLGSAHAVLRWADAFDPLPGESNHQGKRLNAGAVTMAMYVCSLAVYNDEIKEACAAAFRDWQASRPVP